MDLSHVAPPLQDKVKRMPALPLGNLFVRWQARSAMGLMRTRPVEGVRIETPDTLTPPLRLYHPEHKRTDAALLWIHGGGYLIGTPSQDDTLCTNTAKKLGITVISVDYRLAPDHPFPAPLDDCLAAWDWVQRSATTLGIDPARVVVGGQSAGGGLAATLVQRLNDREGNSAYAQWLFCPMLDDRTAARRELDAINHRVWNNRLNAIGWKSYLGTTPGAPDIAPYAVGARREDLTSLPPAWIGVGDIDLFFEEDKAYAQRLEDVGVETEFHIVPGGPHGFEAWAFHTRIAQDFIATGQDWLARTITR